MSSAGVLEPPPSKNHHHHQKHASKNTNNNSNKRKFKYDHRNGRKRSKSFSGCGILINQKPVLPTKFLLGGNINDPLNLNSLQDEEINRAMNAVTPKSSPIPTPPRRKGQIEVIIPPNIHDPLNLIDCADDAEYEQQLCSPVKKGRKKRLKKKRTISATLDSSAETENIQNESANLNPEARTPESTSDSAKIPPEVPEVDSSKSDSEGGSIANIKKDLSIDLSGKKDNAKGVAPKKRKSEDHSHLAKKFKHSMDKIVSPVVPQPGAWLKRTNSVVNKMKPRQNKGQDEAGKLKFKEKNKQFQYGNYNRYYGYRNLNCEIDHRLRVFSHHPYFFEGRDILDIGCNIGHITLSVARDFNARSVLGIDIDQKLINIARKNIKHYVKADEQSPNHYSSPQNYHPQIQWGDDHATSSNADSGSTGGGIGRGDKKSCEFFPISMPILYGAIDIPGFNETYKGGGFPNNVTFKQCNYILEDDSLVALEQPQFDVILCLSITKWIHLNWGDAGIKQAFRRMYAQLRPGGKLILEPQNWASYKKKCKLTETIYKNYNSIEFFPDKFTEYLLSPIVGFAKSEILGFPAHQAKGFRRPIQIFTKSTMFPSERIEATPSSNITPSLEKKTEKSDDSSQAKSTNSSNALLEVTGTVNHVYTNIYGFCKPMDEGGGILDEEASNKESSQELETIKSAEDAEESDKAPT